MFSDYCMNQKRAISPPQTNTILNATPQHPVCSLGLHRPGAGSLVSLRWLPRSPLTGLKEVRRGAVTQSDVISICLARPLLSSASNPSAFSAASVSLSNLLDGFRRRSLVTRTLPDDKHGAGPNVGSGWR